MSVLSGCRVLVAEDEYFLASDTARTLRQAGATIVGPVGRLEQVEDLVERGGFDVALLDIQLDHDLVYAAADRVRAKGVPLVFLTGYDKDAIPSRFHDTIFCQKPCPDEALIKLVKSVCPERP